MSIEESARKCAENLEKYLNSKTDNLSKEISQNIHSENVRVEKYIFKSHDLLITI